MMRGSTWWRKSEERTGCLSNHFYYPHSRKHKPIPRASSLAVPALQCSPLRCPDRAQPPTSLRKGSIGLCSTGPNSRLKTEGDLALSVNVSYFWNDLHKETMLVGSVLRFLLFSIKFSAQLSKQNCNEQCIIHNQRDKAWMYVNSICIYSTSSQGWTSL